MPKYSDLTSGKPLGRRKASGICWEIADLVLPDGGEGLAVYSVSAKPLSSGVLGVCVPLTAGSSFILFFACKEPVENSFNPLWGWGSPACIR